MPKTSPAEPSELAPVRYELCLYLAGSTAASARALVNTRRFCEQHLGGEYRLEIVDITLEPRRVQSAQIVAAPTLVKLLPLPVRRFIGDMSDVERLRTGFGLRGADSGTNH